MKIKEGFLLREVGGTSVVVAVGDAARNFNGMMTLNPTGAFLWRELEKGGRTEELVKALCGEYDVTPETAAGDVERFIQKLKSAGVLNE